MTRNSEFSDEWVAAMKPEEDEAGAATAWSVIKARPLSSCGTNNIMIDADERDLLEDFGERLLSRVQDTR